ncbi:hypothetical protein NH340_JMT00525 [Sarcoptes scabiei]|nr:hypothetical protein NH340_JMT00525 [Sarcoptes scabiei]
MQLNDLTFPLGFIFVFSIIALLYLLIRYKVKINVECWFCMQQSKVCFYQRKSWTCNKCSQYNGFEKDGSYNQPIMEQKRINTNHYCQTKSIDQYESNRLCDDCNKKQTIKLKLISDFVPVKENNFDIEFYQFKHHLEQDYSLCEECEILIDRLIEKRIIKSDNQSSRGSTFYYLIDDILNEDNKRNFFVIKFLIQKIASSARIIALLILNASNSISTFYLFLMTFVKADHSFKLFNSDSFAIKIGKFFKILSIDSNHGYHSVNSLHLVLFVFLTHFIQIQIGSSNWINLGVSIWFDFFQLVCYILLILTIDPNQNDHILTSKELIQLQSVILGILIIFCVIRFLSIVCFLLKSPNRMCSISKKTKGEISYADGNLENESIQADSDLKTRQISEGIRDLVLSESPEISYVKIYQNVLAFKTMNNDRIQGLLMQRTFFNFRNLVPFFDSINNHHHHFENDFKPKSKSNLRIVDYFKPDDAKSLLEDPKWYPIVSAIKTFIIFLSILSLINWLVNKVPFVINYAIDPDGFVLSVKYQPIDSILNKAS